MILEISDCFMISDDYQIESSRNLVTSIIISQVGTILVCINFAFDSIHTKSENHLETIWKIYAKKYFLQSTLSAYCYINLREDWSIKNCTC